ncbi:hypothetical protein BH09PSE5_BH09PSE5_11670 [soil metagenome]
MLRNPDRNNVTKMSRTVFAVGVAVAAAALLPAAHAQVTQTQTMGDLKAFDPQKLSFDEAKALLPGARVSRISHSGSNVWWTNEPEGSFIANSDNRGNGSRSSSSAPGKWRLNPDGKYCVDLEWKRQELENWCRFVLKTTDGYYLVGDNMADTARVFKVKFEK